MTEFRHTVTIEDEGLQVRDIVRTYFDFSARLRNRIKREKITLKNGEKTEGWHKVTAGDVISITLPEEESHFPPENIPLDVVFEDDNIMLINKQPNLVVHPTKGHPAGTVANALTHYMETRGIKWKIRFVNRLDMDTSGLLLIAKNSYCQNNITNQMRKNQVSKKYLAIVRGVIPEEKGTVDLPIGRPDPDDVRRGVMEGGSPSITHYRVLERLREHTLVELLLETGRTHQIRVHMSHMGHPVLGDTLYGGENEELISRQALHAASLTFTHPITGEKTEYRADLPEDMKKAIEALR